MEQQPIRTHTKTLVGIVAVFVLLLVVGAFVSTPAVTCGSGPLPDESEFRWAKLVAWLAVLTLLAGTVASFAGVFLHGRWYRRIGMLLLALVFAVFTLVGAFGAALIGNPCFLY